MRGYDGGTLPLSAHHFLMIVGELLFCEAGGIPDHPLRRLFDEVNVDAVRVLFEELDAEAADAQRSS